jgi:hypothetical protein
MLKGVILHTPYFQKPILAALVAALFVVPAPCQTALSAPAPLQADLSIAPAFQLEALRLDASSQGSDTHSSGNQGPGNQGPDSTTAAPAPAQKPRFITRVLKRGLDDQRQFYFAPFKRSYLKWDAMVLIGTGALLASDRHIENQVPTSHHQAYQDVSNIVIGSFAASLAGVWLHGIKTDNSHAKELGELELEALSNAFLIYAPMQFIAGRQRPGEGNGNGDFWRHHALNTSFPAGHAMFTWTMATVVAHEYPRPWVKALAYGAVTAVSVSRMLARDHWASDMFVGSVLGFSIATHVFHAHCNPEFSEACHPPRDQR